MNDRRGRQVFATLKGKRVLFGLEVDARRAAEVFTQSIQPKQFQAYMAAIRQFSEVSVNPEDQLQQPPTPLNIDNIVVDDRS